MIDQKTIDKNNLTYDDIIKIIMTATGKTEKEAQFIYAIEIGEIDGDVIEVEESE